MQSVRVRMLHAPRSSATALSQLIPALSVTLPSCAGGSPEASVHPIRHGESAEKSARLPHLMRVGRLSQGGQWPMYPHQVARLAWCAPLSERGVVQHMGSMSRQRVGAHVECGAWMCVHVLQVAAAADHSSTASAQ